MPYPSNDAPNEARLSLKHKDIMLDLQEKTALAKITLQSVIDEENVDEASILAKDIAAIGKRAEAAWVEEKIPVDDELKNIKRKWEPLIMAAIDLAQAIKRKATPILIQRAAKEKAELEAQKKEVEKAKQEAEALVKTIDIESAPLDELLSAKAASDAVSVQITKLKEAEGNIGRAGKKGAMITLRTFTSAQIDDPLAAFNFFAKYPTSKAWGYIMAALQRSANTAVRKGVRVPGVVKIEEKKGV